MRVHFELTLRRSGFTSRHRQSSLGYTKISVNTLSECWDCFCTRTLPPFFFPVAQLYLHSSPMASTLLTALGTSSAARTSGTSSQPSMHKRATLKYIKNLTLSCFITAASTAVLHGRTPWHHDVTCCNPPFGHAATATRIRHANMNLTEMRRKATWPLATFHVII